MKHYIWAALWAVFVLVLCCIPMNDAEKLPKFEGMDKLVHTGFFFVFTVLLYFGSIRHHAIISLPNGLLTSLKVVVLSLLLAALTEFLQWKFFTYRTGDLWDLFADSVGTGMGVFAFLFLIILNR
ncbi:VanZ like family protein [bacterium A37T11]|nr:VanZ like family protein [bacterium A37T11]